MLSHCLCILLDARVLPPRLRLRLSLYHVAVALGENQMQDAVLGLKVRHETSRVFLQKRIQQLLQQLQQPDGDDVATEQ